MLRDFFYMTKSDRRIILSMVAVIGAAIAIIYLAGGKSTSPTATTSPVSSDSSVPSALSVPSDLSVSLDPSSPSSPHLFSFDPNTADSTALLRLGLSRWQVRNIVRYRAAGGVYRTKEDFAQLYGLTVKQYRELEPYIHIGTDYQPAATLFPDRARRYANRENSYADNRVGHSDTTLATRHRMKLTDGETIDLATADTTLLQRVPGIGPYYARRIVDYRQRLGGYASLSQLDEIDGFPSEALSFLTLEPGAAAVEKLNVNSLSLNELKRHPYINYYQARAIVDYRRQNGPIADLSELRLLPDFGDEAIKRLRPYVAY